MKVELSDMLRETPLDVAQQAALVRAVLHFAERAHIAEEALLKIAINTGWAHTQLRATDRVTQ